MKISFLSYKSIVFFASLSSHLVHAMEVSVSSPKTSNVSPSHLIVARAIVVQSLLKCADLKDNPEENIDPITKLQIHIEAFADATKKATHLSPKQREKHEQEIAAIEEHGPEAIAQLELPQETQTHRPSAYEKNLRIRYSHSMGNIAQLDQTHPASIPTSSSSCPNLPCQICQGNEQSTYRLPKAIKLADNQYNFLGRPKVCGERFFEK